MTELRHAIALVFGVLDDLSAMAEAKFDKNYIVFKRGIQIS
jgi:hypothetical protein